MPRPLLPALAFASLLVACEANVEEACISGPCGPPPPADGTVGVGDYPCDVYAAVKAKCFFCHTNPTANGAPFPLLTWENTQELVTPTSMMRRWERMFTVVESGSMPLLSSSLMNPDITPEERQLLLDWLNNGATPEPEGEGCDCDDPAACP